jgi:hypothetical protein
MGRLHKRKRRLKKQRVLAPKNTASSTNEITDAYSKEKSNRSDDRCSEFGDYLLEEIERKGSFSDSDARCIVYFAKELTKLDVVNLVCFSLVRRWFKPLDNPELLKLFLAIDFRIPYQHPWPYLYRLTELFPIQFLVACGASKYALEAIKHDESQGKLLEAPVQETTLHSWGAWFVERTFFERFPSQHREYLKLKEPSFIRRAWSSTFLFFSNIGCVRRLWNRTEENNQESKRFSIF